MSTERDGGKGDAPRPLSVSMEQFDKNFDAIFKRPVKTYAGGKPNYVTEPIPFAGMVELEEDNDE